MSLDVTLTLSGCAECGRDSESVFSANVTHNLGKMAAEAGLYGTIWRPDEYGMRLAGDLIASLRAGLEALEREPDRFRATEPENKWGTYDRFVPWVREYLEACRRWPRAVVSVHR